MSSLTTSMIPLGLFKYVSAQGRGRNASAWAQASPRDGSPEQAARAATVQQGLDGQCCTSEGDLHQGQWWGFCSIRSLPSACRRRVAPLVVQFPPFGGALDVGRARPCAPHDAIPPFAGGEAAVRGGEAAVRGGEAPASPTPAAINADNGALQLRRPASWPQRRLAACVARTFTPEM